jgi:hypothetical protein
VLCRSSTGPVLIQDLDLPTAHSSLQSCEASLLQCPIFPSVGGADAHVGATDSECNCAAKDSRQQQNRKGLSWRHGSPWPGFSSPEWEPFQAVTRSLDPKDSVPFQEGVPPNLNSALGPITLPGPAP